VKTLEFIGLAVLVTASMATVDFSYTRNSAALERARNEGRIPGAPWWQQWNHVAARWSLMQWSAVLVGFYLSVTVSMRFLPFEGLGLYIGSAIGARDRRTRSNS